MTNKYDSMRIEGLTKLHRNRHPKTTMGSRSSFAKASKKAPRFAFNAELAAVDRRLDLQETGPRGSMGLACLKNNGNHRPRTIRLRDKV